MRLNFVINYLVVQNKLSFVGRLAALVLVVVLFSCRQTTETPTTIKLFTTVSPATSGVDFVNELTETAEYNYYRYIYAYIGGGVAAGDFNNDGLPDLFFVSNLHESKLYLNEGNLRFQDITQAAGIAKRPGFDAGVTVADVNADGFLDIYLTRGGWDDSEGKFENMLYINNGLNDSTGSSGSVTFTESAAEFGLADADRGIQSSFFDYDRDGDLDLFVANTPDFEDKADEVLSLSAVKTDPATMARKGSDRLYRNEGPGKFVDVSQQSGIEPDLAFGLNPQIGDLNGDGWPDIYVCNDFRMPDFVYLNNKNGTFREGRNELLHHMSFSSMGGDIADIDNDGRFDLYTLDMNPEDYVRSKTTMSMTDPALFDEMVAKNYHHQYMHNMLQVNNGNGTMSEIANMAGVANTDWSWASLLADFDLDGYNDIYVTNGVYRDVIDRDKNNEILSLIRAKGRRPTQAEFLDYARMLPQQKLGNYLFRNRGDLTFEDVSGTWADSAGTFSSGAVYVDLDNDGDLEIVVNNIGDPATILKNEAAEQSTGNYLQVKLKGSEKNPFGVGTTVKLHREDGSVLVRQYIPSRGFLSGTADGLHFGLGEKDESFRLEIVWPDGKSQVIDKPIEPNRTITLYHSEAQPTSRSPQNKPSPLFTKKNFPFRHLDPLFDDYQLQLLLPHKLSQTGPGTTVADVNGDGINDIYLGGGHTQPGQLLVGDAKGSFRPLAVPAFDADRQHEDTGACFFDADADGDPDLYVVSGSYEFPTHSEVLIDRLYLNDGLGNFTKSSGRIPEMTTAGSVVKAADYDDDGDLDLFVGGRVLSSSYPFAPVSYLMENKGGKFTIVTSQIAPQLRTIGMVTDAAWVDIDGDDDSDLVVTGEWMGIEVFENENGQFTSTEKYASLRQRKGWWNRLKIADVDDDGDPDIVAGNLGLNYKFHTSTDKPFQVYADDFDDNGTVDILLAKHYRGNEVPVRGKSCTAQQLPGLASRVTTYHDFASRDVEGLIGPGLENALHFVVDEFRSGIFTNEGGGSFTFKPFENRAQISPINGILYEDFDGDGKRDLLMAGNNYLSETETTRADAGTGILLKGLSQGEFKYLPNTASGFVAARDVRNLFLVGNKDSKSVLVVNNSDTAALYDARSLTQ